LRRGRGVSHCREAGGVGRFSLTAMTMSANLAVARADRCVLRDGSFVPNCGSEVAGPPPEAAHILTL
jgi:hypothetical protein